MSNVKKKITLFIYFMCLIILLLLIFKYLKVSYSNVNNDQTTNKINTISNTNKTNKPKTTTNINSETKKIESTTTKKKTKPITTSSTTTKKLEKYYYYKWLNNERDYTGRTCLLIYDKDGNITKGYAEILYYNKYLKKQFITDDISKCFLEDMKSVKIINVIVDEVKYEQ